jgi:hypothetical protein
MNSLIDLNSSLSLGEKKLISRKLKNGKKNQLAEVFRLIQQKNYNPDDLFQIKKNRQDIFILKNQLYNFILRQIVRSKETKSVDIKARQILSEIEILKNKFLYQLALKKISKLKPQLIEHERFTYLQELLLTETEIKYLILTEQQFNSSITEMKSNFDHFNLKNQEYFNEKIQFFKTMGMIHLDQTPFDNQIPFEDYTDTENRAAHFYNTRSSLIISVQNGEYVAGETKAKTLIDLLQIHKHEFDNLPDQVIDVHYNSALAFLLAGNQKEFKNSIRIMDEIVIKYPNLFDRKSERSLYLKWVDVVRNKATEGQISNLISEYNDHKSNFGIVFQNRILEQTSNYYLSQKNFIAANKWNRKILETPNKKKIHEFSKRAELRNIFIHFKRDRIESMDKAINRFQNNPIYNSDHQLNSLIREISLNPSKNINSLMPIINFWK